MIRQRVRLRRIGVGEIILRLLVSVLGAAMLFYGAMVLLAALKLAPSTINSISAYRTINHALGSITSADITGSDRIITAVAGLVCLFIFAPLAWKALPRPYLTRHRIGLPEQGGPGSTEVAPRALERAAELAAGRDPRVLDARARGHLHAVDVEVELADLEGDLLTPLREIQQRVGRSLTEQGLPPVDVDITFVGAIVPETQKENPT